jgi:hypothetical protein
MILDHEGDHDRDREDWQACQDEADYEAGLKAYYADVSDRDNPHPRGSRRANEWFRGHLDGAYFEEQDRDYR